MKKAFHLVIIIFIFYSNICFASIIESDDIKIIEPALSSVTKDSLVIFNIDDVLIAPTDEFALRGPIRKN